MNKKAFIEELKKRLKHLPKEDREDAIAYYQEYLADMEVDENTDVTERTGNPKDIAREIIANCTEKHIASQKQQGGIKNSATTIWMVILGICAAPIAVPMVMALLVILLSVLIVVISVILAVLISGACFLAAGVLSLIAIVFAPGIGQKLVCMGFGFVGIALGFLFFVASIKLAEVMISGIAGAFKKIFVRKKVA